MTALTLTSALCAQVDPALWFPEKGQGNTAAKKICHRCDDEATCLADALADPELEGVWGGTTFRERQTMRAGKDPLERARIARSRQRKTKLDDITHLLTAGESPENIARRLHSSLGALAKWASRAGANDVAGQFYQADRAVNPDAYHLKDRRANGAKKQKRESA